MAATKSGWRTSEFWIVVGIVLLAVVAVCFGLYRQHQAVTIGGVLSSSIAGGMYAVSRSIVKFLPSLLESFASQTRGKAMSAVPSTTPVSTTTIPPALVSAIAGFENFLEGIINTAIAKVSSTDAMQTTKLQAVADPALDLALYEAEKYGTSMLLVSLQKSHPNIYALIMDAVNAGSLLVPGLTKAA